MVTTDWRRLVACSSVRRESLVLPSASCVPAMLTRLALLRISATRADKRWLMASTMAPMRANSSRPRTARVRERSPLATAAPTMAL